MKKIYTLIVFMITLTISAQAPQGFNYQATVRNNAGALMVNQNVTFKFNVIKDTPTSVPVYSETHNAPTDDLGAVNLVIGKGTPTTGTFATIDWGTGTYFLGIELNIGNGFVAMGASKLQSVPFANFASKVNAENIQGILSIANGGTGATTQNFVDLTTTQIVSGLKTFSDQITSTVPTGIAPFVVTSTTPVANLSILGNAATATTVSAASQPAITNVGTLTSATVNGKAIIGASSAASTSAVLEANSTTQGFLPPRMTSTQRDLITSPAQGLIIYCTNCGTNGEVEVYDGITWTNISGSAVAATLPILTTSTATDITTTTATSGGNISFNGGAPISAKGLCWSTAINPTIANSKTSEGTGTDSFLSTATGLTPDTTYYFRAYATNSSGTSYGNQVTVTTAKQFFAYLFVDSNEVAPRNALASYMAAQGIPNSNFRGFMFGITPSPDQTTFDAQMNAYLSYSGWGSSQPAIFSAPIPTTSGGLDQYGVYKSAYQFETIQVPANTLPTGVYGQFVLFVPIAALNGNHYSTILQGYSPAGLNTFQVSPLKINNNELTIHYTGSINIPAGDYKVYYATPSFRLSPGGSQVYFHGGALVPN